jgi:hypothetical protein
MRTPPPPLLPLLRSQVQGDLLALLYLHAGAEYSLTEAAQRIGVSVKAVHQVVNDLAEGALVTTRRVGNVRLVSANAASPIARPLTDLLAATYGPIPVLADMLAGVAGVERAYVYGSWAARYRGEPGPVPNDVDVIVVGTADRDELDDVVTAASERLGRPVDIRRVGRRAWSATEPSDPFLASVHARPLVELDVGRA